MIESLVPVDSKHPYHKDMFKTLVLLSLESGGEEVFFVIEGCASFAPLDEVKSGDSYFYEESTCPTNFIRIEAIYTKDDDDPHGLFDHRDTAWMTREYLAAREAGSEAEYLRKVFPLLARPARLAESKETR